MKLSVKHERDEVASQFRHIVTIYSEVEFERRYADFRERYPTCGMYLAQSCEMFKKAKCKFPTESTT